MPTFDPTQVLSMYTIDVISMDFLSFFNIKIKKNKAKISAAN
jgi:hypothetical protein